MVGLQQVGDAALARLRVDPDDRLVRTAEVLRVDGQVGHGPLDLVDRDAGCLGPGIHRLEPLLDGVLMRPAERREDEVARPGAPLVHAQLVAVFGGALDLVDVAEVDLGVDTLGQQVHTERDQVDVAGALAVAEQASFDAVGAGHVAELCGGDRGAAVVVRVQRQDDVLAVREAAAHPLDRVGVDVGRRHLDRRGQVDDDLALGGRLEDLDHLVADVEGELELGAGVRLGRVFVEDPRLRNALLELTAQARAVQGDVDDALLVAAEDDLALQHARRVVQVHDGLSCPGDRLVRALDEVLARLRQYLDRHVVGDRPVVDQLTHEVEIGLGCRGEAHLDLLVAHAHQQVEHDALALGAHRVDEGLVAVAQVDRAPARRLRDAGVGPRAVGQVHADLLVVRAVLVYRHAGGLLGVVHDGRFCLVGSGGPVVVAPTTSSATRKALDRGLVAAAKEKLAEAHGDRLHPLRRRHEQITSS